MDGVIARIVNGKGFGFIQGSDGGEFFFHVSALSGVKFENLREGDRVTFVATMGPKGARAESVERSGA